MRYLPPESKVILRLAFVGIILAAAAPAVGGTLVPVILDPKSYTSKSGHYSLVVDPTDPYGRGAAFYRFTGGGREIWSGRKNFTLWDARVTDDGLVAGYAYSHGQSGWGADGDFRVLILERGGATRAEHVEKRNPTGAVEQPAYPWAAGIVLDAENGRLVIRLADRDPHRAIESWSVYSIAKGTLEKSFSPYELSPEVQDGSRFSARKSVVEADTIPGTGITLLNWDRFDNEFDKVGSQFTLIDHEGKPRWSYDMPKASRYAIGLGKDGHFGLLDPASSMRIEFSIARAETGEVRVDEMRRTHVNTLPSSTMQGAKKQIAPLQTLGRIELCALLDPPSEDFDGPVDDASKRRDRAPARPFSYVDVDHAGRIYAIEARAEAIQVFDSRGTHLRSYPPYPVFEDGNHGFAKITVSDEGEMYVYGDKLSFDGSARYIHYSLTGERSRSMGSDSLGEICNGWYCQAKTGNRWIVGSTRVLRVGSDGRILGTIARCPDNRWLASPGHASVAPDGSLAVVARNAVHLYTAGGEPVRTITPSSSIDDSRAQVAHDGKRVVVISGTDVFQLDRAGTVVRRFRLPEALSGVPRGGPFLSPDGQELWVFDGRWSITRYRLR